jgi:hypothetical protein
MDTKPRLEEKRLWSELQLVRSKEDFQKPLTAFEDRKKTLDE